MEKGLKHSLAFILTVVLLIFLSYKMISPYIVAIISAFILAYLIKPLFDLINKKFNKQLSAVFSILILGIVLLIPIYFFIKKVAVGASYISFNGDFSNLFSNLSGFKIFEQIDFVSISNKFISYLTSLAGSAISYVPAFILSLVIAILGVYYILINWNFLTSKLESYLPVKNKKQKMADIKRKTNAIIYGLLLVGIIEGAFSLIGFYFVGVNNYFIAAILIFFSALLPGIGPALIWMPLAIYYLFIGDISTFIGVLIVGAIISYFFDTFVVTKILGSRSKINPFVMFVGIIGGIGVFGLFGIIIGPLILVYTLEFIDQFFGE